MNLIHFNLNFGHFLLLIFEVICKQDLSDLVGRFKWKSQLLSGQLGCVLILEPLDSSRTNQEYIQDSCSDRISCFWQLFLMTCYKGLVIEVKIRIPSINHQALLNFRHFLFVWHRHFQDGSRISQDDWWFFYQVFHNEESLAH